MILAADSMSFVRASEGKQEDRSGAKESILPIIAQAPWRPLSSGDGKKPRFLLELRRLLAELPNFLHCPIYFEGGHENPHERGKIKLKAKINEPPDQGQDQEHIRAYAIQDRPSPRNACRHIRHEKTENERMVCFLIACNGGKNQEKDASGKRQLAHEAVAVFAILLLRAILAGGALE
jgi:hypothetical protein